MPKCFNLVMESGKIIGAALRRSNGLPNTAKKEMPARHRIRSELLMTIAEEQLPGGVFPPGLKGRLPHEYAQQVRILGVLFHGNAGFNAHTDDVIRRAMVRHGILARIARSTWDMEVGILRSTHAMLLVSLVRYGLSIVGTHAYDVLLGRLEVQTANVAARGITGVSRAARLEALHPVAHVL